MRMGKDALQAKLMSGGAYGADPALSSPGCNTRTPTVRVRRRRPGMSDRRSGR